MKYPFVEFSIDNESMGFTPINLSDTREVELCDGSYGLFDYFYARGLCDDEDFNYTADCEEAAIEAIESGKDSGTVKVQGYNVDWQLVYLDERDC